MTLGVLDWSAVTLTSSSGSRPNRDELPLHGIRHSDLIRASSSAHCDDGCVRPDGAVRRASWYPVRLRRIPEARCLSARCRTALADCAIEVNCPEVLIDCSLVPVTTRPRVVEVLAAERRCNLLRGHPSASIRSRLRST